MTKNAKQTDNNVTELVFIIDRSGSMHGLENDTIGGFNSMIAKQKAEPGKVLVSTVLFDSATEVIHDRVPLEEVREMTENDYSVRGCTALLDALGGAIHHIANIHKYARREDVPAKTMFVITTDGMENASHRYSYSDVKRMIEREKSEYGWEFLFIGANIDAIDTAKKYGIAPERAVNYRADSVGTGVVYNSVCKAVSHFRGEATVSDGWKKEIDRDFKNRK